MTAFPFRLVRACAVGGLLVAAVAQAAPSFRSDKNYPNLGLRIRVLGNSQPEPLAQFKTYTYTFTRGEETSKRDLFDPRELWYATQHAGQWRDGDGNVMVLGKPTTMFPEVPKTAGEHVSREDFDKTVADPALAFDSAQPEALAAWVKDFAGCAPTPPERPRTLPFNLADAAFFPTDDATLIYAFRVKTRKPSAQTAPSDWFVAVVRIGDGTPKAKVRKDFETQFLTNVAAVPQTGAAAAAGVQPKSLNASPAGGAAPAAAIPDHPSRTAARKSIANMKGWWFAETPEYIFLSDIRSATGKSLVKELQATLPALRGAEAKLIQPFDPDSDVSVVRIFEEPAAYKQYVGKDLEWSAGAWNPMRRELVILSQGRDKEQTLEIIKHEGFHQFLFYATGMIENAMWFNEGHACFFESADVDSKGRVDIPENGRARLVLENLDAVAGQLPALLRAGRAAFYSGSEQQRALNYAAAWSLVYFLRKGVPNERLTAYSGILDTYLRILAETRDADAATAAAFETVDMRRFQEDFTDFWKKGRSSARRYDPLAEKKENVQR